MISLEAQAAITEKMMLGCFDSCLRLSRARLEFGAQRESARWAVLVSKIKTRAHFELHARNVGVRSFEKHLMQPSASEDAAPSREMSREVNFGSA